MYSVSSGQGIQLGLFDAITDLLAVHSIYWLGVPVLAVLLFFVFKKNRTIPKVKISILCFLFYYYLSVMLTNIVGFPTLREYFRLSGLGESFFNPNINVIPFADGFSLSFMLNILLFVPLGFLCPCISRYYRQAKHAVLLGFGLSLTIELAQLFTQYRATDVDDLLTNTAGTLLGYLCFRLIHRAKKDDRKPDGLWYVPVVVIGMTLVLEFFS